VLSAAIRIFSPINTAIHPVLFVGLGSLGSDDDWHKCNGCDWLCFAEMLSGSIRKVASANDKWVLH
jgi:hypothetical protein